MTWSAEACGGSMKTRMKRSLTAAYVRSRLDYDPQTGGFLWKSITEKTQQDKSWNRKYAGKPAGSLDKDGYVTISLRGKHYRAHQLAWLMVTGEWPVATVDHRDLNKSNNRFRNLRQASHAQNSMNRTRSASNTSGVKGVHWHSGAKRWRAKIKIDGRNIHLGYFDTLEGAGAAYERASQMLFGEFARAS